MISNHTSKVNPFRKEQDPGNTCACEKSPFATCSKQIISFGPPVRTMRGAVLVEGAVGLLLVISGLILAVLFLLNSGVAVYNQEKIGFVANSAATFAANLTNSATRQADVDAQVSDLASNLGLDSANITTTISDVALNSLPAVSVTVSANLPTLLSSNFGGLLPQQLQLSDTAVALKPINTMQYLVIIDPLGTKITVPVINVTGVLPNDGLPAWEFSLAGVRNIR